MSTGAGSRTNTAADSSSTEFLLGWAFRTELELKQEFEHTPTFPLRELSSDALERIERFYGAFLSRQLADGAQLEELMVSSPNLALATLLNRASTMIDAESFFIEYLSGMALPTTEDMVAAADSAARRVIAATETTVPEGMAETPVLVLAAHIGVTAAEIPGLLELLDAQNGEVDVAFLAETEELPVTAAVAQAAPELLAEVLQSVETFRQFAASQGATWRVRRDEWPSPAMVQPVAEHVIAELRERPVGTEDRQHAVGVGTRELRPRIMWNAARRKVCLRLPEQKVVNQPNEEIQWRVSIDGTTTVYRTGRPWGEQRPYSEALDIAVEHQTREIAIHDVTTELNWVVPVIDSEDPTLIFTPKGANVTDKASLHYPELCVVCPNDAQVVDVVTGRDLPIIDTVAVEGWDKWQCVRVDTSDAASLKIDRDGAGEQNVRCVDARQRVIFRDPSPAAACVRTTSGLPVHSESLLAEFPPTVSGQAETWYLTISAFAGIGEEGMEVAPAEPLEVPAEGGVFDIFDPSAWESPWVGEYLIRLRGPRNESFRHECALVEGLHTQSEVAGGSLTFRIPAQGGLSPATLRISHGEKPFDVVPSRVEVAADAAGVDFAITTEEGDQLPLRYTPPRLLFELPLQTQPASWRTTRARVQPAEFDPQGMVRLRVPAGGGVSQPSISVRNNHGTPLRTAKMTRLDDYTFAADMSRLVGSMNAMPAGRMDLEWVDKAVNRKVSVGLADINPAPLTSGVELVDDTLHCSDLPSDHRVGAWIWPLTAPWALANTIDEISAQTPLPEAYRGAGDLAIQLFSSDPYSVQRPARTPAETASTIAQEGYYRSGSAGFTEFSAFLAGESDSAPDDPAIMPMLWDFLASEDRADTPMRRAITAVVRTHPQQALSGLASSLVPSELQPGCVVSSGLVATPMSGTHEGAEATVDATEIHRNAWIGVLSTLAGLPELAAALEEESISPETRQRLRAVMKQLEDAAGKRLVETLSTGRDATLDTACIDRSTVQIAHMDPAQQEMLLEMFFSQAEIVPGPMMADSTRLMAVFETFKHREQLSEILVRHKLIKPALTLMRGIKGAQRRLYNSARIRFDKLDGVDTDNPQDLWALAPVVSMIFALAARMHAHDMLGKSKLLDEVGPGWAEMATVVPDLVTGDVVSSEAMVLAEKYPSLAS
ncbi:MULTISPECIES: hypothetical protein [Corynebacterium]|uniref:hypothetical protein n=1 Tax=Corynebacterium TaxID=1716 RepID=UPI00124F1A7A|nr:MULTISPECIES: hypothetical protein [Corynebacterium]